MAFQAEYAGGDPVKVEYTPVANTNAADVIVVTNSNSVGITTQPIAANTVGAIAVAGGIYRMNANTNANALVKVYWDNTTKQFTTNSTSNTPLGYTVEAAVANTVTRVLHHPF